MTINLSLYPRNEAPIHLVIKYIPELDKQNVFGLWDIENNYVALSWQAFKEFSSLEKQSDKKKFFESLKKVTDSTAPKKENILLIN